MKIKTTQLSYDEVMAITPPKHKKPRIQTLFWRNVMNTLASVCLKGTGFECENIGMDKLSKHEPCLYLMNHSCFTDLMIAAKLIYPKQFHVVCTNDGFVGKENLMYKIGCIPTKKFITDSTLVKDMKFTADRLRSSILMYPEASYSFDGTATPLPSTLGKLVKLLDIPVVMIRTYGAFQKQPLYNCLKTRDIKITATQTLLLTKEQIKELSVKEINAIIREPFRFDHFRWQDENHISVSEDFRAEGLERVLYKCPHCNTEGKMLGEGTTIECRNCGAKYELTEYGRLEKIAASSAGTDEDVACDCHYVTDWYKWERKCVKKELADGTYYLELPVRIMMLVDANSVYEVGEGVLRHDLNGFHLTGCDGKLDYSQTPECSYSLYADYYWYEIGDTICIGDSKRQYYCFPKTEGANVAKARLATEELFKMKIRGTVQGELKESN